MSHIFIVAWGEFSPTLEDVVALSSFPIFEERRTIKLPGDPKEIALDKSDKKKLEALTKALSDSKYTNRARMPRGWNTSLSKWGRD